MPATAETLTDTAAVVNFLAQFSVAERAEAVHVALKQLGLRGEPDRVLACELAWEVHIRGYWSQLRRDDGRAYETLLSAGLAHPVRTMRIKAAAAAQRRATDCPAPACGV